MKESHAVLLYIDVAATHIVGRGVDDTQLNSVVFCPSDREGWVYEIWMRMMRNDEIYPALLLLLALCDSMYFDRRQLIDQLQWSHRSG